MTLIPTVLDQTARGDRAYDIYSLLLRERISSGSASCSSAKRSTTR